MGELPGQGDLRIGSVTLLAGRRIFSEYDSSMPVAWVTGRAVPDAGKAWAALAAAHTETGLMPFLLEDLPGSAGRPWDRGEFYDPADTSELDHIDPAVLMASMWEAAVPSLAEDDDESRACRAPFSREFPGLALAGRHGLKPGQVEAVLGSLPAARIGFAVADRPADVLPRIGWTGAHRYFSAIPVAAMLRSWEDRFGARLLRVGFDRIHLLVERPPRDIAAAQRVAAEHFAFCDESIGAYRDIPHIARGLVGAPIWEFWWD